MHTAASPTLATIGSSTSAMGGNTIGTSGGAPSCGISSLIWKSEEKWRNEGKLGKSQPYERKWQKKSKTGKVHKTQEKLEGNKPKVVKMRKETSKSKFEWFKRKRIKRV
ncbi:hypothetical protein ACSBR2_008706 [Camellia fascicularis]